MNEIRLADMAGIAGMSPSAFSRFFKLHTGRNLSEYIIDLRLGHACRQLVDSTRTIAEIGYSCGFNNLSNFNRIFKKRKGCSPSEFRENYHKTRVIVWELSHSGMIFKKKVEKIWWNQKYFVPLHPQTEKRFRSSTE